MSEAFEKIKAGLDEAAVIAPYVAEIERLTKERDEWRIACIQHGEAAEHDRAARDAAIARAEAAERHIENALHSYQTMVSWLLSPYNQPTPRLHANSSILIGPEVDIRAALTALRARIAAATGDDNGQ